MKQDSVPEILSKLSKLQGWTYDPEKKSLNKKWKLKSFADAVYYLTLIGQEAEEENHHPDIAISQYQYLDVKIRTHTVDGITRKDWSLIDRIDQVKIPG